MIYDGFLFYNELEVLELRLAELNELVDRFILVEATRTFSGRLKPLYFKDNQQHFAPWLAKIIHVIVDDLPGGGPWEREAYQRNAVLRGLSCASADDIIILSDVDEIPRPSALKDWIQGPQPASFFNQRLSYYWLNCVDGTWDGSRVMRYRDFARYHYRADEARHAGFPRIMDGGWHVSFVGGFERIVSKIESFSHQELNRPQFKSEQHVREVMAKAEDLFGRGIHFQFVAIDESFPKVVYTNPKRFESLLYPIPVRA